MRVPEFAVRISLLMIAPLLPSCTASGELGLEPIVTGLNRPIFLTAPAGDPDRLFVVEQDGVIWVVEGGSVVATPFLDITAVVDSSAGEEGLLGMAFHPDYFANGLFYLNYTTEVGGTASRIVQYSVTGDPLTSNVADAGSEVILVTLPKPFENHNAGMLAFGPNDGFLYASTGDGGSGNDPQDNGQNLNSRLGKILRIDVDAGPPYVPATNPFVGMPNHEPLVWSYGLRNPWRFGFDRETGDLFVGDVGQGAWEEVDFQPAESTGGENHGWKIAEGFECRGGGGTCGTTAGFTPPIHVYPTNVDGNSVVGGYVYRGSAIPTLRGVYFFADSGFSKVWSLRYDPVSDTVSEFQERTAELESGGQNVSNPTSFGEDGVGELYLVNINGTVHRITGPAGEPEPNVITPSLPDEFIENGAVLTLSAPSGSDYRWMKNGIDVAPDSGDPDRITGMTNEDLVFDPVLESDAGVYTCEYDNGLKAVLVTEPYTLQVLPAGTLPAVNHLLLLIAGSVLLTGGLTAIWLRH